MTNRVKRTVDMLQRLDCGPDERTIFAVGAVTAVLQTLLIREVFTLVAGNELVIGIMLAVWLAATAIGSSIGNRFSSVSKNVLLFILPVTFIGGMTGIRAVRLLLLPGETFSPGLLILLLFVVELPGAATGGLIFSRLASSSPGRSIYRWEQAGTLLGLFLLSVMVWFFISNYTIAALLLCTLIPLLSSNTGKISVLLLIGLFFLSDKQTASWKYPLPISHITYAHEGEVAQTTVDGQKVTFVNGKLYALSYATPAVEQAVHTPLSVHPHCSSALVINDAGHRCEVVKYKNITFRCIRLNRLIQDSCCPFESITNLTTQNRYDVVILGCGMPDNAATSRFFTKNFIRRMAELTGDSGIFSFTLPFQTDFTDEREERMRSIIFSTLHAVYKFVKILPGEGYTFIASNSDYPLPDTCRVQNSYFQSMVLAGITKERLQKANAPPEQLEQHTAAHPLLLLPTLDRFLGQFKMEWWMYIAIPILFTLILIPVLRLSMDSVSVGSSGLCTGLYSVALLLLYQSLFGTIYAQLSLLLFSLSIGFVAGCFVKKLPYSDFILGIVLGGTLYVFATVSIPPAPLFFIGNALAGLLTSAQFVTRKTNRTALLYAADCTGGICGMALASTILIPLFGMKMVAGGIVLVKGAVGIVAMVRKNSTD